MRTPSTVTRGVFVFFIILGVVVISYLNVSGSGAAGIPYRNDSGTGVIYEPDITATLTATSPPPQFVIHLPLVLKVGKIELNGAWINNSEGKKQYGFLPGDSRQYIVELDNNSGFDTSVKLTWELDGLCEQKLVMDEDFVLKPGVSQIIKEDIAPDCLGVSANSIRVSFGGKTKSLDFNSVVINPSSIIAATGQGFDNCTLPTVSQMQTWWDHSPYATINIYLGGISAACPMNRDSGWLYDVSQQGWSFILTWVGHQAACTSFNHPMSRNLATAKQQGRDNADAAVAMAKQKGFLGDLVIYYDLESFSKGLNDPGCKAAADSFMQGWAERIHELDETAGAYGTPCTSYISEWADNDDPPDDIWIAHWNLPPEYDPSETVWDVPCLSNELWDNNQRLKQYAGGHKETHGGLQLSIDSNVLDGHISAIVSPLLPQVSPPALGSGPPPEIVKVIEPSISALQMISIQEGWVLRGGDLYWTGDGGASWQDISPSPETQILDVTFLDARQGWLVGKKNMDRQVGSLIFLRTQDGGASWQEISVLISDPAEVVEIASAALDLVDLQTAWIALQLHSSSNFSLGRLLATEDGGRTWQERSLPLGEPANFMDAQRGWVTGGPLDQTFYTEDGGESWSLSEMSQEELAPGQDGSIHPFLAIDNVSELPQGMVALDMFDDQTGWAIVQDGSCTGYKPRAGESIPSDSQPLQCESTSQLLMTSDGGISWREISPPR